MKNLLILSFLTLAGSVFAIPNDSIGTKTINGKLYVMHKVTKGEGVYSISKKYGVTLTEIYAANEGSDKTIKIDQVLLIPRKTSTKPGSSATNKGNSGNSSTVTKTEKVYHTVESGQTLSSIAKKYKTTVAHIKELNHLKSDNITLGQKLIVGEKTTTVSKPGAENKDTNETETHEEEIVESPNTVEEPKTPETPVVKKEEGAPVKTENKEKTTAQPGTLVNTYTTDDGDEISESGLAMISSDGELSQERSFILHPTAKIGTIVMITNPVNNSTVFARVVGNCKVETGYVLKISNTVATKLGISQNSEVKLSYAK